MLKKQNIKLDQRRYKRYKSALKVKLCSSEYLLKKDLLSEDISENGICLLSPYKMEIGETVELNIYLPELDHSISTTGKIARRNEINDTKFPFILGVEFTAIDSEDYRHILDHIHYYFLNPQLIQR